MTTVFILVNQYQVLDSDGDNMEIQAVSLDESKMQDRLDEIAERNRGHWSEGHSVYTIENANMEYDSYYIESYEAE